MPVVERKTCSSCGLERDISFFSRDASRIDGRYFRCRECQHDYYIRNRQKISKQKKEYYLKNKEDIKKSVKEYYWKNRETVLERMNKRYKARCSLNATQAGACISCSCNKDAVT